jgi:SAM-dependent methyltransferase
MDGNADALAPLAWSSADSKWIDDGAGRHYGGARWRHPRAALRDPMLVERILARHGVRPSLRPILDAPCGTGRLRGVLERRGLRYVGIDVSGAMLREASLGGPPGSSGLVRGSVARLPFRDESFDVVVCCRLLHHLHDTDELQQAVNELVRVAHRFVIASFWDSASLHAWRRRVGLRRSEGPRGRRAISKRELRGLFDSAGAQVVGFHHSFRFVSQQTFAVAARRVPVDTTERESVDLRTRILDLTLDPLARGAGAGGVSGSFGQAQI